MSFEQFKLLHRLIAQHKQATKEIYGLLELADCADKCFTAEEVMQAAQTLCQQTLQGLRG